MAKRIKWWLVKKHRSYKVDEVARLLSISRDTVWRWIKLGLRVINGGKPYLIAGRDLIQFLKIQAITGQKMPTRRMLVFLVQGTQEARNRNGFFWSCRNNSATMKALCSQCSGRMFKRVSAQRISEIRVKLEVSFKQAHPPIRDSSPACVNDHLKDEVLT